MPLSNIDFWGYRIVDSHLDDVIDTLLSLRKEKKYHIISTLNPELLMMAQNNPQLQTHYQNATLCLPDGIGLVWGIKHINKKRINRICGSDILPKLLENPISIYIIGATADTIENAVKNIQNQYPHIHISGYHHGFFSNQDRPKIIADIASKSPDFIWVGMGCPKQEAFMDDLKLQIQSGIAIGIGGMIDILAGNLKRAPRWVQRYHLEWLYRVLQNPKRISRLKILIPFIKKVLSKKRSQNK